MTGISNEENEKPMNATPDTTPPDTTTTAAAAATAASGGSAVGHERPAARIGTVLWGVAVVAFAAYMLVVTVSGIGIDPFAWLVGSLIIGGIALVAVGITTAARRR